MKMPLEQDAPYWEGFWKPLRVAAGALVLSALAWTQAPAQQPTNSQELDRLYDRLEAYELELAELRSQIFQHPAATEAGYVNANSSLDARVDKIESFLTEKAQQEAKVKLVDKGKPTVKVSGRVHLDNWMFPTSTGGINSLENGNSAISPQDRTQFRRMRFGVKGDINYNMEYKIEMEFAGGNNPEYRDAYLGFNHLPFLQTVLIGNQKRPYGLDHLNSSRYNVFMERPFIIEAFNQDARRIGVCSYGVSDDESWNWRYGYYFQQIAQANAGPIDDSWQGELAGRLANTIWYDEASDGRGYAHWAVSGTLADPNDGFVDNQARFRTRPEARSTSRWLNTDHIDNANAYQLLNVEGVLNLGAFSLVGEWQNCFLQRTGAADCYFKGGYVYAAYWLTGEHTPWERDSGTLGRTKPFENFFLCKRCGGGVSRGLGAWQVAARYSYADLNSQDILGGRGQSLTMGVNWWWNPNGRVQLNYIHGSISNATVHVSGTPDDGTVQSGHYDIFGLRYMVDF